MEEVLRRAERALRLRQERMRQRQRQQSEQEQRLMEEAEVLQRGEASWSGGDWLHADRHYDVVGLSTSTARRLHVATEWQNHLLDLHFSLERRETGMAARRRRADSAEHILDEWEQLVDEERAALRGEVCREALFVLEHNLSEREMLERQRARLLHDLEVSVQRRQVIAIARERRLEESPQSDEEDSWLQELENGLFDQEAVTMERQKAYILLYNSYAIRERIDEKRLQVCPTSELLDQRVLLSSNI